MTGPHRIVLDPVLDPHEDHLLGARAAPGSEAGSGLALLLVHHLHRQGRPRGGGGHTQVPVQGAAPLARLQRWGPVITWS